MLKRLMMLLVLLFMAVPAFASRDGDAISGFLQGALGGSTTQQRNPNNDYYIRTGPHTEVHHFLGSDGQMHAETLNE